MENFNLNQFRKPILTNKILLKNSINETQQFELNELVVHLLKCLLEQNYQSECVNYLTRQTLVLFDNINQSNEFFSFHEYQNENDDFANQFQRYKALYFQTILQNITENEIQSQCLLNNGLLIVFHKLRKLYPDSSRWISSCLSALSYYSTSHKHFFHSGWIGTLAEWLHGSDLHLKLEAAKTLYNLSRKNSFLNPSIYLLHPIFKTDESLLEYDIIFIHGLKGGVFKTWRQSDTMRESLDYTECWPKSWLPEDFKNTRIFAIHYDSFLSSWNIACFDNEFTIKDRSLQLIDELSEAGIGSKPIIWITHSMGGLLVKHMLTHIYNEGSTNPLLNNTKGIVFYSVPHRGSEMAIWSQNIQRIISPSIHVLELRKGLIKFRFWP